MSSEDEIKNMIDDAMGDDNMHLLNEPVVAVGHGTSMIAVCGAVQLKGEDGKDTEGSYGLSNPIVLFHSTHEAVKVSVTEDAKRMANLNGETIEEFLSGIQRGLMYGIMVLNDKTRLIPDNEEDGEE